MPPWRRYRRPRWPARKNSCRDDVDHQRAGVGSAERRRTYRGSMCHQRLLATARPSANTRFPSGWRGTPWMTFFPGWSPCGGGVLGCWRYPPAGQRSPTLMLESVVDRFPIDTRGLHHGRRDLVLVQPERKLVDADRHRRKRQFHRPDTPTIVQPCTSDHTITMHVQASDPAPNRLHPFAPLPRCYGRRPGERPDEIGYWGSRSKRHSSIPRTPHQAESVLSHSQRGR